MYGASEQDLHASLTGIAVEIVEHEPVFTVEQSEPLHDAIPGHHTKNLFLKEPSGRLWLVTAPAKLPIDLKALARLLGAKRFSFASPELLRATLGVEPGSVTPMALFNDRERVVQAVLDRRFTGEGLVAVHPLRNSATAILRGIDLCAWLASLGHVPQIVDLERVRRTDA
jgi:Ala-tRNA(Pro) deacylase